MIPRFYAPDAERRGDAIDLPDDEAQHLTKVLRLGAGAAIRVFNGRGQEFDARVEQAGKRAVRVALVARREPDAVEPAVAITLAQAVLKGDKMDDVVRDAVMMGVAAIVPVVSARSEVTLASVRRSRRRERWERIAISSVKQCGRATVPRIQEALAFEMVPGFLGAMTLPGPALMFVEPGGLPPEGRSHSAGSGLAGGSYTLLTLAELEDPRPREATVVIGPEGGWTPEEIAQGASACRLMTLRGPTLRADAMPIVAMTALLATWNQL